MIAMTFSHIAITCKAPLLVEQFYTKHFGFQRARVVPLGEDQLVFLKRENVYLELFRATSKASGLPATGSGPEYPGWRHLAFMVEDVDAKVAEMGAEARITLGPLSFDAFIPGWRTVWIADPEGNIVEISQGFVDQENPPPLELAPHEL